MNNAEVKQIAFETLLKEYANLEKQYNELTDKYKDLQEENLTLFNMIFGFVYEE